MASEPPPAQSVVPLAPRRTAETHQRVEKPQLPQKLWQQRLQQQQLRKQQLYQAQQLQLQQSQQLQQLQLQQLQQQRLQEQEILKKQELQQAALQQHELAQKHLLRQEKKLQRQKLQLPNQQQARAYPNWPQAKPLPLGTSPPTSLPTPTRLTFNDTFDVSVLFGPSSFFRNLNGDGDNEAIRSETNNVSQPGSRVGTPRQPAHLPPDPPLCSARGRLAFGEFAWNNDATRKDSDGLPVAPSTAPAPPAGAQFGTPGTSSNSNSGSLRTSVFKRPGSVLHGASGTTNQRDSDGSERGRHLKPWHAEPPPGIPYYNVPPPNRRFGGLAKPGNRGYVPPPPPQQMGMASGRSMSGNYRGHGGVFGGNTASGNNNNINSNSSSNNSSYMNNSGNNGNNAAAAAAAGNNRLQKPVVRLMDYNPWTGNHPEDRLTDGTIRYGFGERQSSQAQSSTDTASARVWLPQLLKQKNSTAVLGQALVLANALSREKNHIAPASQFKLPPRVTVTDTRRETWLRDLTNPAIPLRKLSRTIPHGLRGKVLLEQCMLKNVPVDRAMWLARCVGAQELRAFKRKGMANVATLAESELRWLKDWTLTVQQFLESFMVDIDMEKPLSRKALQYATRFVRQLYLERLIEQDQFLIWMLSGLRNASRLPAAPSPTPYFDVWVLIVEEYILDILQKRRTSCHLAITLLSRVEYLSQLLSAPGSVSKAKKLLQTVVLRNPDAFVCHSVWPRFEGILDGLFDSPIPPAPSQPHNILATPEADGTYIVASIRERNACLRSESPEQMELALNKLLLLDDALRRPVDFESHFRPFLRFARESSVPFVIQWCASFYRPGLAKVYIAAQLIIELCNNDAKMVTGYILAFLSATSSKEEAGGGTGAGKGPNGERQAYDTRTQAYLQQKLHVLNGQQSEGSRALYHLVGLLIDKKAFSPSSYLASIILQSRPSDVENIAPAGDPRVRLAAELPVDLLDRSSSTLRANHLRRLGYDTDYEAEDLSQLIANMEKVLGPRPPAVAAAVDAGHSTRDSAFSPSSFQSPALVSTQTQTDSAAPLRTHMSLQLLGRCIEDRSRNVKMAVARWLEQRVVTPMRKYTEAVLQAEKEGTCSSSHQSPLAGDSPAHMPVETADGIRMLIEKTEDVHLLAAFLLVLASSPQGIMVVAMCIDTVHLHLTALMATDEARDLYNKLMAQALSMTIGVDSGNGSLNAFQTLLPPGTDLRPLIQALPDLVERMVPPGPGSVVLGVDRQPIRLIPLKGSSSMYDMQAAADAYPRHYDAGPNVAAEIRRRLLEMDRRLFVATFDANGSPVSEDRAMHGQEDAVAEEVREELIRIAGSGALVEGATMDRLFGSIAMMQEKWRRAYVESDPGRSRNELRVAASLFTWLRRCNTAHFDSVMVKWLKRQRTMRDRPPVAIIYPVLIVFGCLDLACLMATTADEPAREPGGMIQSPARNTWRSSYLQDVLSLLSVPLSSAEGHPMLTCGECQRFRLFQSAAAFAAPDGIASLVRNAVAEMTLWRQYQRAAASAAPATVATAAVSTTTSARKTLDALHVSRLLRTAALADATAAAHALARTTDQMVRRGLWEMVTLALTRKVQPGRPALEMLRHLDVFAANMGQLALGLVVSPGPYASAAEQAKEADNLAGLILRAVSDFQFSSLSALNSLPMDMVSSLKEHAQARFLDMIPTRKQPLSTSGSDGGGSTGGDAAAQHFHKACGYLGIVRNIMFHQRQLRKEQQQQQQQHIVPTGAMLDTSIVDKLGELWCLLQETTAAPAAATAVATATAEPTNSRAVDCGRHSLLQDWLPALLSLILFHLPASDVLGVGVEGPRGGANMVTNTSAVVANNNRSNPHDMEQEAIQAGACIALASLCMEISPSGDRRAKDVRSGTGGSEGSEGRHVPETSKWLSLQSRLFDTALLLADGLSDEVRQHCVKTLREISQNSGGGGDLHADMAYLLSCPMSGSLYYPRLYLERLPMMPIFGRPPPMPPREWSQGATTATGEGAAGAGLKRFGGMAITEKNKRIRFGLKTWDAVSDPTPTVQDNDTAVNLWLLEATKVVRQRRR